MQRPQIFFRRIFRSEASVYKSYFFQNSRNYSTLDSDTITVISHVFAYSSRWRRKPWQVYTGRTQLGLCFPFFGRSSSLSFPSSSRTSSSFLTCSNIRILADFFRAIVSEVRANSLLSSASPMANWFNSISVHSLSLTSGCFFPVLAAAILFPWSLDCLQLLALGCVSLSAFRFYTGRLKRLRRLIHQLSASIGRT